MTWWLYQMAWVIVAVGFGGLLVWLLREVFHG
jgi:hypothetical protein